MTDQTTRDPGDNENDRLSGLEGARDALTEKLVDAMTPGLMVECSPLEADRAGAFHEDAMSESDAMESVANADDADHDVMLNASNVVVGAFGARDMSGKREV
jgi:hypothetical protein